MKDIKSKYKTIDLFAGIGGIRKAFEETGRFITVFANDFDKDCKTTYDLNFDGVKLTVDDIKNVETKNIKDFQILLAGFPCQAFSVAGYREGFNDKKGRGNLFFEIARILSDKNPKPVAFLLENVKNLKNHDNGKTFKIITKTLEDLGYTVDSRVLNSLEYGGVPQNRERIYIIGFLDEKKFYKFNWPDRIRLKTRVSDVLDSDIEKKYYYEGKALYEKIAGYPFKVGGVYQWRRKYIRENKKGVCPTLTANMGTGGHNVPLIKDHKGIRKLTPRECARLQGLSDSFKLPESLPDSKLYKQIGNSVTTTVIEQLAEQIAEALDS